MSLNKVRIKLGRYRIRGMVTGILEEEVALDMTKQIVRSFSFLSLMFLTQFGCSTIGEEKSFSDYEQWKGRFIESSNASSTKTFPETPDLPEKPRLNDYLSYATANSPELRAAFETWKASLERIAQVRALPNPQLRYSYFIRAVETRAGPQRNRFGLSQMIPWPQKLSLNGDVAYQNSEAMRKRLEDAKQQLFYKVKLAYFDLYYLNQSINITKQTITLARYYERIALVRYRASGGKHPDVIRAQLELGRLEDRLKSLNDMRQPLNASLNATLNRPSDAPIDWPKTLESKKAWPTEKELLAILRQSNSELSVFDSEIERENKAVARARKEYYPDFTLGLDYIDTASAIRSGTPDSSKDPIVLNFGISLPIWGSKYSAGVKEAKARKLSIQAKKKGLLRRLEAMLQRALFNLRDSGRKIDLYKKTLIPKAEQAQRASVTSFEAGKSDFLSLIDVERTLLEFLLNYQKALTDQARANALIERLVGSDLEKKP